MTAAGDRQHLAALRTRLGDASRDWSLGRSGDELFAELAPGTPPAHVATLTADCSWQDRELLLHAHADLTFLLRLLMEAFAVIRRLQPRDEAADRARQPQANAKPKDYAAECAMKCGERGFQTYLREMHALETTDAERINARIRSVLKIQSRAELNTDPNAAARWQSLKASFELWSRTS